jgi:hypothetical protein
MAGYVSYVIVFTPASWQQFKAAGANTAGFPDRAMSRAAKIAPKDTLLCYLVDGGGWIAALRVVGAAYWVAEPSIWPQGAFPVRVPVEVLVELPTQRAVRPSEVIDLLPRLWKANLKQGGAWAAFVRGTPRRWPDDEARTLLDAIYRKANAE